MDTHDPLADWLAAEVAQRARNASGPGAGVASPDIAASMTGLQLLQATLRGELPHAAIATTLDFLLIAVEHGKAVFQGTPGPAHLNPMGGVHGGWYATLLDSAMGCAVHSGLPLGKAYTTLELKVNLVRAITPQVQRVRAEGRVIHLGGQTATADARLVGPDGRLYAHASTTCLVFDMQRRKP
ncbi:MAG: PaaI family thioesterase [Rubrivivax sp.]|nr:PaaI family thioesterase [Rubrivivax sp.]MDP3225684.1 PaaI family thioesterase [Rubrivivax sp.]MDP3616196.1 PaaI family thioesterase [Rubrivivax sp.]